MMVHLRGVPSLSDGAETTALSVSRHGPCRDSRFDPNFLNKTVGYADAHSVADIASVYNEGEVER